MVIPAGAVEFAGVLADCARSLALPGFTGGVCTRQKSDRSPVTDVDEAIERALRDLIRGRFPDHSIVGEEQGESPALSAYRWVIDPIDGTRAFIAGVPTFSTLIALEMDGEPLLGVADFPALSLRIVGTGPTTMCSGEPLCVSGVDTLQSAVVATTSSYYFTHEQRESFDAMALASRSYMLGGDAYLYAMLARGRIDLVIDVGLKHYDVAALVAILKGAGASLHLSHTAQGIAFFAASSPALLEEARHSFRL